jgi:hypothetical protein
LDALTEPVMKRAMEILVVQGSGDTWARNARDRNFLLNSRTSASVHTRSVVGINVG